MTAGSENQIFAKIVGYIADGMVEGDDVDLPDGLDRLPDTLREISHAFEAAGGFQFEPDQALILSHVFTVLEAAMRTLSAQAEEGGQHNAAAKIEWAANQAREMMGYLMEKHGSGDGGTLVLVVEDEDI